VLSLADTIILTRLLLGAFVSSRSLLLSAFAGLNLLQSSICWFCPAALVFHRLGFATREREFRDLTDTLAAASAEVTHRNLAKQLPPGPWLDWAARLIPSLTTEAVIAWLDAGQPDPDQAAARIRAAVHGVIDAAATGSLG